MSRSAGSTNSFTGTKMMELSQDSYEVCELQWQFYTKAGNEQMQAHLYQKAQQYYSRAQELAHLLLEEAQRDRTHPDAIHPYVVSCHNLADSWLKLDDAQQAEMILCQVFNRVSQILTDGDLPNPLRLEALKALKAVSYEMEHFYRSLDRVDRAREMFDRANTVAEKFLASFDESGMSDS